VPQAAIARLPAEWRDLIAKGLVDLNARRETIEAFSSR
jgi:hypothetical protein